MISLSKYIAQSGYCSRRKAVTVIHNKRVRVNGTLVLEPAHRIATTDIITVGSSVIRPEKRYYVLLNKPRGYITTVSDERGRKTVLDLLGSRISARVYPVGRLDRDTTGLLLLTNDGSLAQRLHHPRYEIQKSYSVVADKPVSRVHLDHIQKGVVLEDGKVTVDSVRFVTPRDRSKLIVTLHSGRNRVIRRLFKKLGYVVITLHRNAYAHLTAHDLAIGQWRFLTPLERESLR